MVYICTKFCKGIYTSILKIAKGNNLFINVGGITILPFMCISQFSAKAAFCAICRTDFEYDAAKTVPEGHLGRTLISGLSQD